MTPERWRQIEELYHSARERGTGALAQADPELRRAVEVLLAQDGTDDKILDRPAAELLTDATLTRLSAGSQLGPYRIEHPLGAGGMGEVFEAVDTRLGRKVAIKVCSERFSGRFEREAKAISALNHPHICSLHDVGPNYLVMELVEGETLAAKLKRGPLPIELVLRYGVEIADAFAEAHAKGIIHRDLKPGNVMLTTKGIKVLDFGLAKSETDETLTESRVVMGTPGYMAPEQLAGKQCDARTDIYSLGLMLYEMATGKRPSQDRPASWEGLPPQFAHVVARCLAAEPASRWQSAADVKAELEWAGKIQPETPTAQQPKWIWLAAVAAVVLSAVAGWAVSHFSGATSGASVLKFSVPAPERSGFSPTNIPAISPDGHHLAFAARASGGDLLWVRDMDSLASRPLPGTEGAFWPFWSPDSRFIAFFAGTKLKKIDVTGGSALTLCEAPNGRGGSWNKNDVIVFAPTPNGALFRVPAAGGSATPVTTLNQALSETSHRSPWFLPDGRHFLYTSRDANAEKTAIYVGEIDSNRDVKNQRLILLANTSAVYAPPGYLLFVREGTLMAQPFDASEATTTGDATPLGEQVDSVRGEMTTAGQFSASQVGVLAYSSGGSQGNLQLTWFNRSGNVLGTVGTPGPLFRPAISPDDKTVAIDRQDPQTGVFDLWLHDLARGTASRFTFNSQATYPVWSPDGSLIAFESWGGKISQKATSGASQDETLDMGPYSKIPLDWSRDGRYIFETVIDPKTGRDIWVLPLFGNRKPFPYLQTVFEERNARLSPSGLWLAYSSNETKRDEVYVQTFPKQGGKWQISINGGRLPMWSRDGKELFFVGADRKMMAVEVKGDGTKFEAGVPKPLFDTHLGDNVGLWYDVTKDGRFLIPIQVDQGSSASLTVVVNWVAGLKK